MKRKHPEDTHDHDYAETESPHKLKKIIKGLMLKKKSLRTN